jgi:hypothetical protein
MSVQAMSWVLEHSTAEHSARLVHISLANHANGDGEDSYPSIGRIACETLLGESTVRAAIERLKDAGMIVEIGVSSKRTRRFRLILADPADPAESAPPQNLHPRRIEQPSPQDLARDPAESAPEPLTEPSKDPSLSSSPDGAEPETRHDVQRLCQLLAELRRHNDPKAKVRPDTKAWRDPMRLLIDSDGRDTAVIEQVIRWTQADSWEMANVQSPDSLRRRFGQLLLKSQRGGTRGNTAAVVDMSKYDRAASRTGAAA